ncbi:glycerophosphodiester phosphodiesterase family protein [Kaistia terrae]|uniref:Glycerophosphodiester phosphodiesterase family protein n=1 Tax=Kaistia terrae TaxID=537017 RepID=A0ABW0Q1E9_9HYPH|nr:glycerophosphodiester phosphodiesterase family protein [Kaistia terrae]MCX5579754.1 glycerophosphodiester phosphodiesterase family protein [Kaistia terrae]
MSEIMAHRGARNLWAENSCLGFRETLKHDFEAIEFDLHLTDAGELVVIHDATLDRTTTGTGPVRSLTSESRKAIRLKGPDGALIDEGVPIFEDVLEIFRDHPNTQLYVELKSDGEGRPYPGIVAKAAEMLRAYGLVDRSCLHSFDIQVVRDVRDLAPEFMRLISVDRVWAERQGGLEAFMTEVDDLVDVIGIHHELFEAEFDTIVRVRGLDRVSVWTINDPDLMRHWIARAPRWLVSDNPVLLRELMRKAHA